MKKYFYVFMLLAFAPLPARAQYIGTTAPQSVLVTLASATACTGSAQTFSTTNSTLNAAGFRNIGQTSHFVTAIPAANAAFTVEIDGVDTLGNVSRISDLAWVTALTFSSQNGTIPGYGQYANIQVVVTCAAATGTFTLTYSGTSSSGSGSVGSFQLTQLVKEIFSGTSLTGGATSGLIQTPYGSTQGLINVKFGGGGTLGITVNCPSPLLNTASSQYTFTAQNSTNMQAFSVPAINCPFATITTGSIPGMTLVLEYIFQAPGLNASPPTYSNLTSLNPLPSSLALMAEKSGRWGNQISTPSAGSQATTSKIAGGAGTHHVADCVSWSAGAATAPAATVLTINLRDGATGAGTILWQTTIAAAAAATQHGSGSVCGLNLVGSSNTAMTLEFAAGLTNEVESVSLTGFDVQ